MPIPALPLFRHRDTVVTPADQNQFVTQFETTMDTMSNDVIPALNLAITDINEKVITATTARDESEDARDIAVAAKDEAVSAIATLTEGAIDDTTIAINKAFSNSYIEANYYDKDEVDNKIVNKITDQSIDGIKTFIKSPIVPTPTIGTQAVNKNYLDFNKFGANQTLQNFTLTKSLGVTYTNDTNETIWVIVSSYISTGLYNFRLFVTIDNGAPIPFGADSSSAGNTTPSGSFFVRPGETFKVTSEQPTTLLYWVEFK